MAVPSENRRFAFQGKYGNFLDLNSVGYYSSRIGGGNKLVQLKIDHTFHYVRDGEGVFISKDKTYNLKNGDLFYTPPGNPVIYYPDDSNMWSYYFFHLGDDFGEKFASLLGVSEESPIISTKNSQSIDALFDKLVSLDIPLPELYHTTLSTLLQLLTLTQTFEATYKTAVSGASFVENVRKTIELNYKNPEFTINSISNLLHVNHTYMSRLFKEKMKVTPVAYLCELRLLRAAKLIRDESLPLKKVCEAVGFADELYFMKCFKKKYGMTIREYRNLYKNKM
ncbi:MAG: AraC family transcriptional regulator [Oscillospiraceae bacterium]|nr:AraC family transcriptional regulator [Oscillospiraceae bacterium]